MSDTRVVSKQNGRNRTRASKPIAGGIYTREGGRIRRVVGATYDLMAKAPEPGGELWRELCNLADKYMNAAEDVRGQGDELPHSLAAALGVLVVGVSQTTTREAFRAFVSDAFAYLAHASSTRGRLQCLSEHPKPASCVHLKTGQS